MSVYRWFSELVNEFADANQWLDTEVLFRTTSQLNALYEFILDKKAPGASSQAVQGHDHHTQGGRTLARGTTFCGGAGKNQWFKCNFSSSGVWLAADNANTAALQRSTDTFWGYFFGQSTGSSAPYTGPVAWGSFRFMFKDQSSPYTVQARLYNNTMGLASDVQSFSVPMTMGVTQAVIAESVLFEEVPIQPGWNSFQLQLQANGTGFDVFSVQGLTLEAADVDGCYEASTGVSPLGGA